MEIICKGFALSNWGVNGSKLAFAVWSNLFVLLVEFGINVFNTLILVPSYSHWLSLTMLTSSKSPIAIVSITEARADIASTFGSI